MLLIGFGCYDVSCGTMRCSRGFIRASIGVMWAKHKIAVALRMRKYCFSEGMYLGVTFLHTLASSLCAFHRAPPDGPNAINLQT